MNKANLQDLRETARRAFNWSSFDADKRGDKAISDYQALLDEDLKEVPQEEQERYVDNFHKYLLNWLSAQSRCANCMVTGPANFNVSRNEKANKSEMNRYNEFKEWRERALSAIKRKAEQEYQNSLTDEQKLEQKWDVVKIEIDTVFITQLLYGKLERIALKGEVELMQKSIDYVRELNAQRSKPIFTERHKFFKLIELAEQWRNKIEQKNNRESSELDFEGGKVVKNFAEDRLQIIFDSKPDYATILNLKKNGFRWSPSFGAWQRQLTANAYDATTRVISVTYEQLKSM